jgi:hypothetical protein
MTEKTREPQLAFALYQGMASVMPIKTHKKRGL